MKRIVKNMTALGVLQIANYLIPLLVLPVVSRVLGATLFGKHARTRHDAVGKNPKQATCWQTPEKCDLFLLIAELLAS